MSGLRTEGAAGAALLLVIGALALEFPFAQFFGKRPAASHSRRPSVAIRFVELDKDGETAVMRMAKDSWRREGSIRRVSTDLFFEELPPAVPVPVLPVSSRTHPDGLPLVETELPPFLPSRRAPSPRRLDAIQPEKEEMSAFSRDELLRLD